MEVRWKFSICVRVDRYIVSRISHFARRKGQEKEISWEQGLHLSRLLVPLLYYKRNKKLIKKLKNITTRKEDILFTPSPLVLALLFMHRRKTLNCCTFKGYCLKFPTDICSTRLHLSSSPQLVDKTTFLIRCVSCILTSSFGL